MEEEFAFQIEFTGSSNITILHGVHCSLCLRTIYATGRKCGVSCRLGAILGIYTHSLGYYHSKTKLEGPELILILFHGYILRQLKHSVKPRSAFSGRLVVKL